MFGWIDGVRRRIGEVSYCIRFTPRKNGSIWSVVNINRAAALTSQARMHPAGLRAFGARLEERSGVYAFEQSDIRFAPEQESLFRASPEAWAFFQTQPKWYQRTHGLPQTWRVVSAKRDGPG